MPDFSQMPREQLIKQCEDFWTICVQLKAEFKNLKSSDQEKQSYIDSLEKKLDLTLIELENLENLSQKRISELMSSSAKLVSDIEELKSDLEKERAISFIDGLGGNSIAFGIGVGLGVLATIIYFNVTD